MYLAGLNLSLSPCQQLEAVVCASTIASYTLFIRAARSSDALAKQKGGDLNPSYLRDKSRAGVFATPVHPITIMLPPILYVGAVFINSLRRPHWMAAISLGELPQLSATLLATSAARAHAKVAIRLLASIASVGVFAMTSSAIQQLGKQFHFMGIREKQPQIVSTGAYSVVRHPLYSLALLQTTVSAVMFWSYIPLVSLVLTGIAFAVKMPIEEQLMLDHPILGPEYAEYGRKVPDRIIPYIW